MNNNPIEIDKYTSLGTAPYNGQVISLGWEVPETRTNPNNGWPRLSFAIPALKLSLQRAANDARLRKGGIRRGRRKAACSR